ncbi:hypothetical protein RHGRI_016617 [Rhododendron griersonianum]|uniref:Uncharacterized protein n=1 Tax=Rhododendron griersonianum TaxID=479676 RepID=A0AAV6JUQ7_9ERIC|nr:hypothetical protein RHGRI_016617 [Rhododendron griersonianum]KAG5543916.1 hypothetical protein RHGRI_016617 [Rhododendron griersonianum]
MAMLTARFVVPYALITSLRTRPHTKSQTLKYFSPISHSKILKQKSCFLVNQPSRYSSNGKRDFFVFNNLLPNVPGLPSGPPSNSWKSWILGAVITIILPFITHKWGPLLQITKEIETTVETVDQVVEVIEEVAEGVEKVADEIGNELAEGGKLRGAFDSIENAARKAANGAHLVEEVDKEVEELMKPVNHPANGTEK